ncbi:MAG: trypsin-like peptidase domain-containing protein [Flavobacteriales bacterium]|nr:trypsin-like peptidase domain-containing protein [Flavobacteriales bacterium]
MNRTLTLTTVAAALLCGLSLQAQVSFGGRPMGLSKNSPLPKAPTAVMPQVDALSLIAEDEARAAEGIKGPYRFGFNHETNLSLENSGVWHELENGDRIWSLAIECPGAFSINFEFNDYVVPSGAAVYVYNEQHEVLGAFMAESNPGHTELGVTQLAGDKITVEYHEPAAVRGEGRLRIGQVTHAYRDIFNLAKGFNTSGACNNNVICPEGDPWRDQIRSVAMITVGGSGFCTGQLINNCANDGTPYFLTANHCLGGNNTWVFRFNWNSPTCTPTTNAPTNQTVSGSQLRANSAGSDMALLQLNSTPPANYNVFYTGWDNTATPPTRSTTIHHPDGDIKKISFDLDPATAVNWQGAACWRIANWEDGTTEPGSSGAGLWNQNGLLIGQLFGGQASCSNNVNDYYGRFNVSYPLLTNWLGSCGNTLQGYDPNNTAQLEYDAALTEMSGVPASLCNQNTINPSVIIRNNGTVTLTSLTLTYQIGGGAPGNVVWNGSLATGATANYALPAINVGNGAQTITVTASLPNGQADQNPSNNVRTQNFNVASPGEYVNLAITLDNYGSETTWQLATDEGSILYTGGPYQDGQNQTVVNNQWCLGTGCYVFTLFDDYGDGICCEYGNGSYTINSLGGTNYVTANGQFTETDVRPFCVTATGIEEALAAGRLSIAPNPSTGTFMVALPGNLSGTGVLRVRDAVGKLVLEQAVAGGVELLPVDLFNQQNGIYVVEFTAGGFRAVERVLLAR